MPFFWRNDTNNAFIDAYTGVLDEMNNTDSQLNIIKQRVIYSAQKINLEAFCNDVYDETLRRIYIGQQVNPNDVFMGLDSESPDGEVFMGLDSESPDGEVFMGLDGEGGGTMYVYVYVPTVLSSQNSLIKQGVENYVRMPAVVEIINF